jgi:hypothetical protein
LSAVAEASIFLLPFLSVGFVPIRKVVIPSEPATRNLLFASVSFRRAALFAQERVGALVPHFPHGTRFAANNLLITVLPYRRAKTRRNLGSAEFTKDSVPARLAASVGSSLPNLKRCTAA